ncbi:MAG: hypothetical protein AAFQ80_23225 [Cyanobacteria bacterium J06621_8]
MQSQNSNFKKLSDQLVTKWIIVALLITFLAFTTLILIGLKTQYLQVDFCVATVNCSQASVQVTGDAQSIEIDMEEDPLEELTSSSKPIKVTVKPLGAAIVGGAISGATLVALIGLGFISLPIEFALAIGALIGSGSYVALKTLY